MRLFIAFFTIMALMAVALMPLDMALAQEANPMRALPETVDRGQTFDVFVTFTAPADKFNAIGLTDLAPDGWDVTVDKMWSTPSADAILATGNKAEVGWFGELGIGFYKDTSFSVMYKVTVPDDASAGIHTFNGSLEYYLASEGPYDENVTGDSEIEVRVAATPIISCSPTSFSFSATQGGSNPASQTLEIWNSGIDTIAWTLSDDAAWLSENATSGSSTNEHDTVAVSVNIAGMSAGDYSANITITAAGASNSPRTVPISLHISSPAPEMSFKPGRLSFTAVEGGPTHAVEMLEIWNSGVDTLDWSLSDDAAWLSEDPTSGSSIGEHDTVDVSVDIAGMSVGDYSTNITITAEASNSPQVVPVSLHISPAAPEISFTPEMLNFTAIEGGSTPPNKTLTIWNSGIEMLNWFVSDDAEWLSQDPTSGNSTSPYDTTSVTVLVNTAGMSAGDYSANITITAPGASNSPQTVPVSLHIGGIAPPPPSPIPAWLSQYWWAIVAGIVVVVLLVYLLRRRRRWV